MARKRRVPEVLWRLFHERARLLADTITSLLPPTPPSEKGCRCKGLQCLGCSREVMSFLLRPDDPSDYRKLLTESFIVVSDNAPPISVFYPECHWPQFEIVKRTTELLMYEQPKGDNVLCSGYDKSNHSSPIIELLSCASWGRLLKRVGDDFMVYLLKYTSIFLPLPCKKYHQVAGPPINDLCPKLFKPSTKSEDQLPSLVPCGPRKKRKRIDDINLITERQKRCSSLNFNGENHSIPLIRRHGDRQHQTSLSEVLNSTDGSSAGETNKEPIGKLQESLNQITITSRKCSRPFSWQRRRKRMQLSSEEAGVNNCSMSPTDTDCLPGRLPCNVQNCLSHRTVMPWQCSCCLVLQALQTVPRNAKINRKLMFYNFESSLSVLPKSHVLNSLKRNLASSKQLTAEIFGLPETSASAQPIQCLHSNGASTIDSSCLYHSLVKWLKSVICRVHCCQYSRLLNKHCGVSSPYQYDSEKPSSIVEEDIMQTEPHGSDIKHCINTHTLETIENQFDAVKSYCARSQVVSYIWAVCRSVLPPQFLGTPSNWRIMRRNISKFIHLRRFENFSLKLCMHGLKVSRFPFLSNQYFLHGLNSKMLKHRGECKGGLQKEFSNWSNALDVLKKKLLERWIFWFFSCLVVPLLQANFYITESQHGKQDVYYYRKSVWQNLINKTITYMKDWRYSYLDDVSVRNILRGRLFGFSKLRILPKGNGVRMVANLKGSSRMLANESSAEVQSHKMMRKAKPFPKKVKFDYFHSVNFVLRDAHAILKGLQLKEPDKLGSSVFNYNDVYKKLCPFLVAQKKKLSTLPGLFIVISDVSKAFDSVDQDKLLCVMKDVIQKDAYFLKQYVQVVCRKDSLWVQKHLRMLDENISTGYPRLASAVPSSPLHTILVNQEGGKLVKKEVVFSYLKEHVKHNVLQFDKKFYMQGVGISQGGILSSLLCSLYYGHLERNVIFPFLEKTCESASCVENHPVKVRSEDVSVSCPSYILLRFIDDLLFISTSKKQALSFFSRLQRGFRDYNCYMNEKKFGVNFDIGQISGIPSKRMYAGEDGTSFLQWSGLLINCCTLEVQADYTKYLNNHLSSTLTVCWQGKGKPRIQLKEKLCGFMRPKCHSIFYDSNINSAAVVRLNIYQAFLLCAMKFHCYTRELSCICQPHKRFLLHSIKRSLRYMFALIKKRMCSMRLDSNFQPMLQLEEGEVEWLGFHAYIQVLRRKQTRHKELLSLLRSKLLGHRISGSVSPQLEYAVNASHSSLLWKIRY
ncbi:Telomerase reverse transcriptase [Quillaja saponaria]|uniref:Telomerase reverse transcriptase n=1 Tax=Quillaja saponaria TaxID=32244 RepID=A0AAD7L082_QUISA|nr:Telomerase reverse transcriptase [Quillaja saponaria]